MTTYPEVERPQLFKVQFKDKKEGSQLSMEAMEQTFHFTFSTALSFGSGEEEGRVIANCPYSLKYEWLLGTSSQLEENYKQALLRNGFVDAYVKWVDREIGYGLFAESDIPEQTFIGEYTGLVRSVDKKKPELNPYCFHYPTRFWSYHPYVIDAKFRGNLARFINHSLNPNLQPLWVVEKGLLHLIFYAKVSIPAGDQLTFDYGVGHGAFHALIHKDR